MGSTSTKRNICTLIDSSAIAQERMRSSHQRLSKIEGVRRSSCDQSCCPIFCVSGSTAAAGSTFVVRATGNGSPFQSYVVQSEFNLTYSAVRSQVQKRIDSLP